MTQLQNKHIVVSGAGRGLGRAFAEACCEAGATVIIAELDVELGQTAASELQAAGHDAKFEFVDISDPGAIEALAIRLGEGNAAIDGLINNAGLATGIGGKTFEEIDIETWDRVHQINVRGTWLMIKALAPLLRRAGGGRIINLASDTALWGAPVLLHYVASKGAERGRATDRLYLNFADGKKTWKAGETISRYSVAIRVVIESDQPDADALSARTKRDTVPPFRTSCTTTRLIRRPKGSPTNSRAATTPKSCRRFDA